MQQRPQVHDPVVLRDQADRGYASRVENLAEGLVVVAQPPGLPDDGFVNGTELSVVWAESVDSVAVLPTRILAAHMQGPAKVWSLVVTGPASLEQRRRVERVDVSGPVTLRPPAGVATTAVDGGLVDLSEDALRCSVRTGSADGFLGSHNQVVAEFSVGTADFALPGRVEFVRATKHPTQWEELVVLFDQPVAKVDVLRKHLFAHEATEPRDRDDPGES
ncbi:MAG TPA: PilZ domain-containing protein [Marmoricola sp.]|nr:PilZ domain-containing protein [Marmoricola sp.]